MVYVSTHSNRTTTASLRAVITIVGFLILPGSVLATGAVAAPDGNSGGTVRWSRALTEASRPGPSIMDSRFRKTLPAVHPPEITVISPTPNSAAEWDVYELTIENHDSYANPFWDVLITGTFTGPNSQVVTAEGFYYDANTWKLRFSPTQTGTWQYSLQFTTSGGVAENSGSFQCTEPAEDNHGFVSIADGNPHTYVHSDGTVFIPVGINGHTPAVTAAFLGFDPGSSQVTDMWDYITNKQINTYRLHMFHQTMFPTSFDWNSLEGQANLLYNTGSLDSYNLEDAKLIDRWLSQTKERNIYWYMCLFTIFDITEYPFSQCYWSTSLGGPFPSLSVTYTAGYPDGLALQEKYVRYVVNRYAAFRNVFVWEYNNEYGSFSSPAWLQAMDETIDQADPLQRPHTVSFWNFNWSKISLVDSSPAIDITDDHCYPGSGFTDFTIDSLIQYQASYRYNKYSKPVMFGEYGGGEQNLAQHWHDYERIGYWAGFTAGANMLIWFSGYNDQDGINYNRSTLEWMNHFHTVIDNLKNYAAMVPRNDLVSTADPDKMRAYCLAGDDEYLVYIHHYSDHTNTMHSKTMTMSLPAYQSYEARWYDPASGGLLSSTQENSGNGTVELTIPDFSIDVALYLNLTTDVFQEDHNQVPESFSLSQNYPNPFNGNTVFKFDLPADTEVSMKIYNIVGNDIYTVVNGKLEAGQYTMHWDAGSCPTGIYFAVFRAGEYTKTVKLIVIK